MPRALRDLLAQALTVHVPDPADTWRQVYDTQGPSRQAGPSRENPPPAPVQPAARARFRLLPGGRGRL
ncbi:hypothetical protein [Streptomyces sp. NPDC020983]|uniref:hypothetical protein n=1 Tax=Streptomyces sp. NPDC020983 TaxID=3365106 RepID=UPI0037916A6C